MNHVSRISVAFFALVSLFYVPPLSSDVGLMLPRRSPVSVEQSIVREAWAQGVPVRLAFWLAVSESGLRPGAVHKNGRGKASDYGLMQLNGRSFPGAQRMTPQENIAAGVTYLAKQYRACHKRPGCAVRAYRSGKVR